MSYIIFASNAAYEQICVAYILFIFKNFYPVYFSIFIEAAYQ
jgi:hypothetical protein